MLRTVTALGLLLIVAPVSAAEVQCADDEARVEGTEQQVWVSLEDGIHVIDPDADPGTPGSVEAFCGDHVGLVAIVIPAPKPNPNDEPGARDAELVEGYWTAEGELPNARRGDLLFAEAPADADDSVAGSGDGPKDVFEADAPLAADTPSDDIKLGGCSAQPGSAGPLAWVFALVALALRRRGRDQ